MTIHERIRLRRKELGLSAEQVALALNVSRATVYRYESGDIKKLPIDALIPLSNILKLDPSHLLNHKEGGNGNA